MKVAHVGITQESLVLALGLPRDARVIGASVDQADGRIVLLVEQADLIDQPEGAVGKAVPLVDLESGTFAGWMQQ